VRGYYSNRFRGQHYAAATAELRFPLIAAFSGVVFGDAGHVWAINHESSRIAETGGFGLRYGLLPDRQIRLRLDVGFGHDQWGVFFKFNEAF
jgi:outer membrane protein assembly factor BamA